MVRSTPISDSSRATLVSTRAAGVAAGLGTASGYNEVARGMGAGSGFDRAPNSAGSLASGAGVGVCRDTVLSFQKAMAGSCSRGRNF